MDTTDTFTIEGVAVIVPPRLIAKFEAAERKLKETYGSSPPVPALIRLWIACATSWRILNEFEQAVLDMQNGSTKPTPNGAIDDDCF